MSLKYVKQFIISAVLLLSITRVLSQSNPDSILLANSQPLKVKLNKGLFGLAKPVFGTYSTIEINKLDSQVIRKKTKDSSVISADISSDGSDLDQSKYMTIEKTKFYKLSLSTGSGACDAVFAIASVSHEKRQTFLGKVLSKQDEGKDEVLDENRNVPGIINTNHDSSAWSFLIEGFTSNPASISGGYLKNDADSIHIENYSSFNADIILVDENGGSLAALAFKQKNPVLWIRNDVDKNYQDAMATLLAIMLSIKDF